MRSMWKGYLKVSLVTIPVRMYAASRKTSIRFNLLHKECNSRIKQQNYCPHCNRVVSYDELVRGYEYGKDAYVVLEEEDFEKARKESTDAIEVMKFVDESQIHPIYYSDSHYLAPDGKAGVEAFALFHRAMEETRRAAIAKAVIRNREHLFAVRPYDGTLAACTLRFTDEIRKPEGIEWLDQVDEVSPDANSLKMAHAVIDNLAGEFEPGEFADEYSQTLREVIRAKAEGEQIEAAPEAEREKVVDLIEALKRSVEQTEKAPKKKQAKAGRRRRGAAKKAEEG